MLPCFNIAASAEHSATPMDNMIAGKGDLRYIEKTKMAPLYSSDFCTFATFEKMEVMHGTCTGYK